MKILGEKTFKYVILNSYILKNFGISLSENCEWGPWALQFAKFKIFWGSFGAKMPAHDNAHF